VYENVWLTQGFVKPTGLINMPQPLKIFTTSEYKNTQNNSLTIDLSEEKT